MDEIPLVAASGRGVLDGAFRLLRALPDVRGDHQVADLVAATGIPRPSVHRLLAQLRDAGAVERRARRWVLSPSLLGITRHVEPVDGLRSAASGLLQAVRERTGATVSLVVPSEHGFVALEMIPGRVSMPFEARSGFVMPEGTAAAVALAPPGPGRRVAVPGARASGAGRLATGVDDEDVMGGVTCYAAALPGPGVPLVALQIATPAGVPARGFAPVVHQAVATLGSLVAHR